LKQRSEVDLAAEIAANIAIASLQTAQATTPAPATEKPPTSAYRSPFELAQKNIDLMLNLDFQLDEQLKRLPPAGNSSDLGDLLANGF